MKRLRKMFQMTKEKLVHSPSRRPLWMAVALKVWNSQSKELKLRVHYPEQKINFDKQLQKVSL